MVFAPVDCVTVVHSSVGDSYDNVASFIEKLNAVDPTQFKWNVKRSDSEINFMGMVAWTLNVWSSRSKTANRYALSIFGKNLRSL